MQLKFLAGLQEGLWPTERETNASQKVPPGSRPQFEANQQASIESWLTIILLSTTDVVSAETLHHKTLTTTTRCTL